MCEQQNVESTPKTKIHAHLSQTDWTNAKRKVGIVLLAESWQGFGLIITISSNKLIVWIFVCPNALSDFHSTRQVMFASLAQYTQGM